MGQAQGPAIPVAIPACGSDPLRRLEGGRGHLTDSPQGRGETRSVQRSIRDVHGRLICRNTLWEPETWEVLLLFTKVTAMGATVAGVCLRPAKRRYRLSVAAGERAQSDDQSDDHWRLRYRR